GTLGSLIGLSRALGIAPLVRVPDSNSALISRVLDAGAEGIVAPHIDTAEQAEAVVKATRFPPRGSRGAGYNGRAGLWGAISRDEYVRFGHDEVAVIVQIESRQAVTNASSIAGIDGVDGLLLGPADLALSEGVAEGAPQVVELAQHAVAAAREMNTAVGGAVAEASKIPETSDADWSFAILGNDATMLRRGA